MSMLADDSCRRLRQSVYFVLIATSLGIMLGRILAVDSVDMYGLDKDRIRIALAEKKKSLEAERKTVEEIKEELTLSGQELEAKLRRRRPFLSANDRSRWCTVRALVEDEMRVEGTPFAIDKVIQERGWDTIDMVKHDGHLYSSKPPLFPALGRPVLDHPPALRRDARHPALRDRAVHAGYHKRSADAGLFLAPVEADRTVRPDGLGQGLRDDRRRFRHVPDHLRGGSQQPYSGRGLRRDRDAPHGPCLVRRRAPLVVFCAGGPGGCVHGDR